MPMQRHAVELREQINRAHPELRQLLIEFDIRYCLERTRACAVFRQGKQTAAGAAPMMMASVRSNVPGGSAPGVFSVALCRSDFFFAVR